MLGTDGDVLGWLNAGREMHREQCIISTGSRLVPSVFLYPHSTDYFEERQALAGQKLARARLPLY